MNIKSTANFGALRVELSKLADRLDDVAIGKALQIGGEVINRQARENVHIITTDLRESLEVSQPFQEEGATTVRVGTNLIYSEVEELGGVLPISNKQRSYLTHVKGFRIRSTTSHIIRHPHPYLAPAFYDKERAALELVARELREDIING